MIIYILRRLLLSLITFIILLSVCFCLNFYTQGALLSHFPLNDALSTYLTNLLQGNLGLSQINGAPLLPLIQQMLPVTLELCLLGAVFALVVGIPLGILAGVYKNKPLDKTISIFALIGVSLPTFWLALLLLIFFSYYLGWLPDSARYDLLYPIERKTGFILIDVFVSQYTHSEQILKEILINLFKHMVMPVLTLAFPLMVELIRLLRDSVIEISQQNYIKAATTRGLSRFTIVYRHIFHNAFPAIIPHLGVQFSTLLTLTMVVETIFEWPGIGNGLVYAIRHQDYSMLSASVMVMGSFVIIINLFSDILGAILSPLKYKELYVQ